MLFVVLGFIVLFVLIAVFGHQQTTARREKLRALAGRLGWRFDPDRDRTHDERYKPIEVFRRGGSRYAYNTIEGEAEVGGRAFAVRMGDYHYSTKSRNSKGKTTTHHHRFSYALFVPPFPPTPELAIRPEAFFDWIGAFFGFDDIDFESVEFSKKFHVKSADKRFAYDLIDARMMEFLLKASPQSLELDNGFCCVTHGGRLWGPDDFEATIAWTRRFFELVPRHLIDDLESRR